MLTLALIASYMVDVVVHDRQLLPGCCALLGFQSRVNLLLYSNRRLRGLCATTCTRWFNPFSYILVGMFLSLTALLLTTSCVMYIKPYRISADGWLRCTGEVCRQQWGKCSSCSCKSSLSVFHWYTSWSSWVRGRLRLSATLRRKSWIKGCCRQLCSNLFCLCGFISIPTGPHGILNCPGLCIHSVL